MTKCVKSLLEVEAHRNPILNKKYTEQRETLRKRTAIARAGDCTEEGPEILETMIQGRKWMDIKGRKNDVGEEEGLYFPERGILV